MAKKPADRFASAGELAKAATAAASGGPVPPAPAAVPLPSAAPLLSPPPASTRQFSAVYENPAGTGYTPYPPPEVGPPETPTPVRKSRFGPTQVALVVATIVLFGAAVVLAAMLMNGNDSGTPTPTPTTIAVPPPSVSTTTETIEPSTSTSPPSTTSSTPATTSPSTSGTPLPGVSGTDAQGFVGHAARCDAGSTPVAAIRTAQSLAVVCETTPGSYYYHGERLRDGANVQLANAMPAGGGFDVTNPADGARYEVRPDHLTIYSKGRVDSNEPALEYSSG
jgi:hypothetical protein